MIACDKNKFVLNYSQLTSSLFHVQKVPVFLFLDVYLYMWLCVCTVYILLK